MMYGKYTITVGRDGKVFVFPSLSHNYEAGDKYYVLINKSAVETDGIYLYYKFNGEIDPEEKLLKTYKVPVNKHLKVPPQYREEMSGKCYLIGVGCGIELHKAENFDKEKHVSFEDLEQMIKELGLQNEEK